MANNFDAARLALRSLYPRNDLLLDDKGLPSVMVYIPKFRLCDVLSTTDTSIHPAFIVNGKEIDGFYMGKYQSCVYNGVQYSLPGQIPATGVRVIEKINAATRKGTGWHEVTLAEWAAVALWSHKHGCEPKGNNDSGRDHAETMYEADKYKQTSTSGIVKTGTGPTSWSHNGQADGIWDMNGNAEAYVTGARVVYGELQIIENNNAADSNCYHGEGSTAWKAIRASDGELITPDGSGTTSGSIKFSYSSARWTYSTTASNQQKYPQNAMLGSGVYVDSAVCDKAKLLLRALALLPDWDVTGDGIDSDYGNDRLSVVNGDSERLLTCGGVYYMKDYDGLFNINLTELRTEEDSLCGCRLAYIDMPE